MQVFSNVGVLYMNKWNGLDKDALKGSLPYCFVKKKKEEEEEEINFIKTPNYLGGL